jgi:hypothetical protein
MRHTYRLAIFFGALMSLSANAAKADTIAISGVSGGTLLTSATDQVYGDDLPGEYVHRRNGPRSL